MKKSKVIELVKKGELAVHMNRKEVKDIELLREILKEAFPEDNYIPVGGVAFYFKTNGYDKWDYEYETTLPTIKITEIEQEENYTTHQTSGSSNVFTSKRNVFETKEEETFESGELVEVSNNDCRSWVKAYFIGFCKIGYAVCEKESESDISNLGYWSHIRKINPAIEQIREIMKKNNISKEEI
jgi:hypothetical protein